MTKQIFKVIIKKQQLRKLIMIFTYKNFIIWQAEDGIRAIDQSKNIRLKLELNQDKILSIQIQDMIDWIDKLGKIKNKAMAKKGNRL
ncbi:hypothetical protein [Planktothrix sp.]|uniref:hypothetical protein n=2 Tax=Planktothrix sp. TaxID=3088171 RepID=UPI0038D39638